MMPSVSVIVPVYNAEKTLGRCLDSLTNQTLKELEIICVDDGSKDSSLIICQRYQSSDSRFRVYTKNNGGVSSARNLGLKKASCDWICFIDADDELKENAIGLLLSYMTPGIDMVMGGYEILDENGEITYSIRDRETFLLDKSSALAQMYHPFPYKYIGYVWGKLFRKSIIDKFDILFDERVSFNEDRLFVTQYICQSKKIIHTSESVYLYYENPNSAMSSLNKEFNKKFLTDLDGFIRMKECITESGAEKAIVRFARDGILSSYRRIKEMMAHFKVRDHRLSMGLQWRLIKGLGPWHYILFIIKALRDKMFNITFYHII